MVLRLVGLTSLGLAVLLVGGCSGSGQLPTAEPPTIAVSVSASSTATPVPDAASPPSPTDTFEIDASWTPRATLAPSAAEALIVELFKTNRGCFLPCWWGITPGKTQWREAEAFLATFARRIAKRSVMISPGEGPPTQVEIMDVFVRVPGATSEHRMSFYVQAGQVFEVYVSRIEGASAYVLHSLLSQYGAPGEVWLMTFPTSLEGYIPFHVVIYYPDRRFLAHYEFSGTRYGERIAACSSAQGPEIWAWDNGHHETVGSLEQVLIGPDSANPLRPLEDASELDLQGFFQEFSGSDGCIETPRDLWK